MIHAISLCSLHTAGVTCMTNWRATSFPGSLFSASIVVETMEAEKRDPGNEVDWRGAWNKVLSESFCNVKFSLIFSSKCKVIWKESMAIDQKSLKAFFHAPFQLLKRISFVSLITKRFGWIVEYISLYWRILKLANSTQVGSTTDSGLITAWGECATF